MRKTTMAPGEVYHIYNRSVEKQTIFRNARDYARLLFYILHLQSPRPLFNITHNVTAFLKRGYFPVEPSILHDIEQKRMVELIAFSTMPNHFHLIVQAIEENGIPHYLMRVQDAYAKYFNIKYKRKGRLFEGPYGAVHVESNNQLLYLSTYLHNNPRTIGRWEGKEEQYRWSSYQDYAQTNRWGPLLKPEIILGQFRSPADYHKFVQTSIAKAREVLDIPTPYPSPYSSIKP